MSCVLNLLLTVEDEFPLTCRYCPAKGIRQPIALGSYYILIWHPLCVFFELFRLQRTSSTPLILTIAKDNNTVFVINIQWNRNYTLLAVQYTGFAMFVGSILYYYNIDWFILLTHTNLCRKWATPIMNGWLEVDLWVDELNLHIYSVLKISVQFCVTLHCSIF